MSNNATLARIPPVVIPTAQDFLFTRPGGRWNKVRQQSAWHRERLIRLAAQYALVPKHPAVGKRTFVQTHIVHVVQRAGGRFLRGHDHVGSARVSWEIVTDQEEIEQDVMRILRHLHHHHTTHGHGIQSIAHDIVHDLNTLSTNLTQLGTTVEHLSSNSASGGGPKRTANDDNTSSSWTIPTAKKIRKKVHAMLQEALDCQTLLLHMGRRDDDVMTTDGDGRGEDASELTLESSSESTTPESHSSSYS